MCVYPNIRVYQYISKPNRVNIFQKSCQHITLSTLIYFPSLHEGEQAFLLDAEGFNLN